MAKKKNTRKSKAKAKTPGLLTRLREMDWDQIRRVLVTCGWVLLVIVIIGGWVTGIPRLEAFAASQHEGVEPEIVFNDPPAWAESGDLAALLDHVARQELDDNPMQAADLVNVRSALQECGWLDEVTQVRQVRADLVEVDAVFTQPYALVRSPDGRADHLIDVHGRLLPRSFAPGTKPNFIVITNPAVDPPREHGQGWGSDDVIAALRVVRLLVDQPWVSQIAEIDLSEYRQTQSLVFVTATGGRIIWGRPPGDEYGAEVPPTEKIRYLQLNFEQFGRIDRNQAEVNITADRMTIAN